MGQPRKIERKISDDLRNQLKEIGISGSHYDDLIDDYIALWHIKNALIEDINNRGVSVFWSNGGGQEGYKKNDSVSELVKINGQMLKILAELGLRATEFKAVDEDEL